LIFSLIEISVSVSLVFFLRNIINVNNNVKKSWFLTLTFSYLRLLFYFATLFRCPIDHRRFGLPVRHKPAVFGDRCWSLLFLERQLIVFVMPLFHQLGLRSERRMLYDIQTNQLGKD
jgi:hypothetical protein